MRMLHTEMMRPMGAVVTMDFSSVHGRCLAVQLHSAYHGCFSILRRLARVGSLRLGRGPTELDTQEHAAQVLPSADLRSS